MTKTKIENLLPKNPGPMGGIYSQKIRCGKSACRCANGPPHEGYYYYIRRIEGKLVKTYIPKALVKEVTMLLEIAKNGRRLMRVVTRASTESSRSFSAQLRDQGRHLQSLVGSTGHDYAEDKNEK